MRMYMKLSEGGLKDSIKRGAKKILDKYIDIGIAFEDMLNISEPLEAQEVPAKPDEKLDLSLLHSFMSDYIGMLMVGIKEFSEDADIANPEDLQYKLISGCEIKGESIVLALSEIDGADAGKVILSPTRYGSFAEREVDDIPIYSSMYRIFFYGGEALEYLDTENLGTIEYVVE
jgi:hypothetical protein